jgi:Icc-related predicted phosphoesterase
MNLVMLSDTHAAHHAPRPSLPAGDVLIHCGDLTHFGSFAELKAEISWLKSQPHAFKILISGNHDTCLENLMAKDMEAELRRMLHPIVYLRDSGVIIEGTRFWGSPWIPPYAGAFNSDLEVRQAKFGAIPNVDVLITHGPPLGVIDDGIGCPALLSAVQRIKPRVHCFGHVHKSHGAIAPRYFNVATAPCRITL